MTIDANPHYLALLLFLSLHLRVRQMVFKRASTQVQAELEKQRLWSPLLPDSWLRKLLEECIW